MMASTLSMVLATTLLLTLLPGPATPRASRPLTSSEVDDILYDIQDVMDVLLDSSSATHPGDSSSSPPLPPPSSGMLGAPLVRFPPGRVLVSNGRSLPALSPSLSSQQRDESSLLPSSFHTSEERGLLKRVRVAAGRSGTSWPQGVVSSGPVKRGEVSLCHLLGFPMGAGCSTGRQNRSRMWSVPEARSGSTGLLTAERKSSPSLYLFGGAIGR